MNVLVACEFSGVVRDAFIEMGHNAWSCDFIPSDGKDENNGRHYQCDVTCLLGGETTWDLMIAHPPCTYLCNAGVRHLYENVTSKNGVRAKVSGAARWKQMENACAFFNELMNADIPKICVENPIPHKYARELIGNYSQLIQPWQFGHGETKATCIWLKNLPKLVPTNIVSGRSHRVHMMPGGKNQSRNRSITFKGFGEAMANQWSIN